MIPLRPYQLEAKAAVAAEHRKHRATLCVMPTGTGKTRLFTAVASGVVEAGNRVLVVAHRQELIEQAHDSIKSLTPHSVEIEMGEAHVDERAFWTKPSVVVASVQSLVSGPKKHRRMTKFDVEDFGLVIFDEAHRSVAKSYREVAAHFAGVPILGVTATPDRLDKKALGNLYDSVAYRYDIREAVDQGWLVPIRTHQILVDGVDFDQCKVVAGDFTDVELSSILGAEKPMHAIATSLIQEAGDRRTIAFSPTVDHATRLAEILNRYQPGRAVVVHAGTDKDVRRGLIKKFREGEIQYLCNCGIFTEGFDAPEAEVVANCRPTKSRALYTQCVGRVTRPLPGIVDGVDDRPASIAASAKPFCEVIDYTGVSQKHRLISPVDVLGGDALDDRVRKRANEIAADGTIDTLEAIEQAEADVAEMERQARERDEQAQRARNSVTAKAKYRKQTVDAFATLGLGEPEPDLSMDLKLNHVSLSSKERGALSRAKIDPGNMSPDAAARLAKELLRREGAGLATYRQVRQLKLKGIDAKNMPRETANKLMAQLAQNNWRLPAGGLRI
jgi:superfamily II DNA or RNA helicase